jgi:hypothetical protein
MIIMEGDAGPVPAPCAYKSLGRWTEGKLPGDLQ